MLLDYIRYVAFKGRLRKFFESDFLKYVYIEDTTGQHLRFCPEFINERLAWAAHAFAQQLYWEHHSRDLFFSRVRESIGISGGPDTLSLASQYAGGSPQTFNYKEIRIPPLQIIIDVNPVRWSREYNEVRSYEGVNVVYRRAAPAVGHFGSGNRIFDLERGPNAYGTLCGTFRTSNSQVFGLTCAHVASSRASISVESPRRIWNMLLPIWPRRQQFGNVSQVALSSSSRETGSAATGLDAALIKCAAAARINNENVASRAVIRPITTILQEEPVRFQGAARSSESLARIAAVTVRKSIDLLRDGKLLEMNDLLMLGHRYPMYIAQRVSRPGDSGAAVRQGFLTFGPFDEINQWHGMVIGGDDTGSFATHAEHLWSWAAQAIGDKDLEFDF